MIRVSSRTITTLAAMAVLAVAGCSSAPAPHRTLPPNDPNVRACHQAKAAGKIKPPTKAPAMLRGAAVTAANDSLQAALRREARQDEAPKFSLPAGVNIARQLQRSCARYGVDVGFGGV